MGESAWIDDDPGHSPNFRLLNPVDQGAFVVALEALQLRAVLVGEPLQALINGIQRFGSVDLGLARPEHIQIRTVKYQDPGALYARFLLGRPCGHQRSLPQIPPSCPLYGGFARKRRAQTRLAGFVAAEQLDDDIDARALDRAPGGRVLQSC